MPRISPSNQPNASNVNVKKLFRERLMDRFGANDFVRVINIDNEPFYWQYLPAKNEDLQMSNDGMHRYAMREEPEYFMLNPGESEVVVGENAYIMIEALFKKLAAKKVIESQGEAKAGVARNFNFSDALAQEQIIDKVFLGKETPSFGGFNEPAKTPSPTGPKGKAA